MMEPASGRDRGTQTSDLLELGYRHTPAMGRLKYADPRDLPSFPSLGLRENGAAASAAASLGWANQRPSEAPKPLISQSASTAAFLATGHKRNPPVEPSTSTEGARAALLATGSAPRESTPRVPQDTSAKSRTKCTTRTGVPPVHQSGYVAPPSTYSPLAAAKDAMSTAMPRSKSTPPTHQDYTDDVNASYNALSAASLAHGVPSRSTEPIEEAGAVPYTTMPRDMFTATPPVKPELDEQNRADVIHASALAMAKQMYNRQQSMIHATKRARSDSQPTGQTQEPLWDTRQAALKPKSVANLQEAAYKLAQERLSKLYEDHQRARDYQEYYGSSAPQHRPTMMSKLRLRSSSEGEIDDRKQSEKIRQQMSIFSTKLSEVDEKKRQKDREALLAVAKKNVQAYLQGMDQKMYAETGRVRPAVRSEWESKVQATMQTNNETRSQNKGMIDIGGGKFIGASDVDAIAAKRVQPVLDEIDERAERERERLTAQKAEEQERREEAEAKKAREQEVKDIHKRLIEQNRQREKEKRQQEREDEKAKKEEEKAARAGRKRQERINKHRSQEYMENQPDELHLSTTKQGKRFERNSRRLSSRAQTFPDLETGTETAPADGPRSPSESAPSTSRLKSWLKARFSRPRAKTAGEVELGGDKKQGFIGGAALREQQLANRSTPSFDNRSSSIREVALAGTPWNEQQPASRFDTRGRRCDSKGVSPVSSASSESEGFVEARSQWSETMTPPPTIGDVRTQKTSSPTRDSRFREIME